MHTIHHKTALALVCGCCFALHTAELQATEPPSSNQASAQKAQSSTNALRIVLPPLEKSAEKHQLYFVKLLELALQKTEAQDGSFTLEHYHELFTSKRFLNELARPDGVINVLWTMDSDARENELLPIKISLLRDLDSYRFFMIRREDQEKFHRIHTLDELRQFTAGSGSAWPDTNILQHNGLPVLTTAHYELLFNMLANKRFDYFPRGSYEIWNEQQGHAQQGFIIENSLMLYYPVNTYFFVNKDNKHLAERIERGLRIALRDGSADQLFFSIESFKYGYDEIHNPARQKLSLKISSTRE